MLQCCHKLVKYAMYQIIMSTILVIFFVFSFCTLVMWGANLYETFIGKNKKYRYQDKIERQGDYPN